MFGIRYGRYGEDSVPCLWVYRPLRGGGPILGAALRSQGDGVGLLRWQPAWYYYNNPELSNYKQLRF